MAEVIDGKVMIEANIWEDVKGTHFLPFAAEVEDDKKTVIETVCVAISDDPADKTLERYEVIEP